MKKRTGIICMTVCVFGLSLAVCGLQADGRQKTADSQEAIQQKTADSQEAIQQDTARPSSEREALLTDALRSSYYQGQGKRAFSMFRKNIFKKLINDWTCEDLINAAWNYDSFASYQMLDGDRNSLSDKDLYYCTYSADEGKYGYIIVAYDGDSLRRISSAETSYPYDLDTGMEAVLAGLEETGMDPYSASAARVSITVGEDIREAIRITDGEGHECICYFGKEGVSFEELSGF